MKKLLWLLYFLPSIAFAVPPQRLAPVNANTQTCVVITSYTWVAVPTTALAGRQDTWFSNGSSDTYVMSTDNTVAISTGVTPFILPAKDSRNYRFDDGITTYFRSLGNGPGNVCADEQTYR